MIPPDIASRLRIAADSTVQPVATSRQVSEALANFVPGQRVLAEIQAVLPNGNYRAMVAQREMTLALPFSAKSGDSLDLEVVNTDGKLTLAVLSRPPADSTAKEAVATTLSRAGQLIATLLSETGAETPTTKAASLNGSAPIATRPPAPGETLAPLLKQAITESGIFYESHQAQWLEGRLPTEQLLREPQGQLSSALRDLPAGGGTENVPPPPPGLQPGTSAANPTPAEAKPAGPPVTTPPAGGPLAATSNPQANPATPSAGSAAPTAANAASSATTTGLIAPELTPIVQHQLDALANQTYLWQGQVWPGQDMYWEIEEENRRQGSHESDAAAPTWRTRVSLTLPQLGEIEARFQIHGNGVRVVLDAGQPQTQALLRADAETFRRQLDAAGLNLETLGITRHATE